MFKLLLFLSALAILSGSCLGYPTVNIDSGFDVSKFGRGQGVAPYFSLGFDGPRLRQGKSKRQTDYGGGPDQGGSYGGSNVASPQVNTGLDASGLAAPQLGLTVDGSPITI